MLALPILRWGAGDAVLPGIILVSVGLQVGAVLGLLIVAWGTRETLRIAILIIGATWLVEAIGSKTGWPFGAYHYPALLQPQIGQVPVLIPLAWLMMLPCAWAIAQPWRRYSGLFVVLSALALTAWDLLLDPQMVAWGLWVWEMPGGYFGIPWQNYAGWLLTAGLLTHLIRPKPLSEPLLLWIYTITWFLESLGLVFFWGLPGPALVGGLVMGGFVWLGWSKRLAVRP